jgi:hypothetical protein
MRGDGGDRRLVEVELPGQPPCLAVTALAERRSP